MLCVLLSAQLALPALAAPPPRLRPVGDVDVVRAHAGQRHAQKELVGPKRDVRIDAPDDDEDVAPEPATVDTRRAERFFSEVLLADPNEVFTGIDVQGQDVAVISEGGVVHTATDGGVRFHRVPFGDVEWMPQFAQSPRSALNIVLGTSVVIPGRTAAADLIRRPPPTRTTREDHHPDDHRAVFSNILDYGRVGRGIWLGYGNNMHFKHSPSVLFTFDQETGVDFLEGGAAETNPAFWTSPWVRGLPRADYWVAKGDASINPYLVPNSAKHLYRALLFAPAKEHGKGTVLFHPRRRGELYALTEQGVFKSIDHGTTFHSVFRAPQERCCSSGGFSEDGSLYVVGQSSLFISTDGETFVPHGDLRPGTHLEKRTNASGSVLLEMNRHTAVLVDEDVQKVRLRGEDAVLLGIVDDVDRPSPFGRDEPPGPLVATRSGLRYVDDDRKLQPIGGDFVGREAVDGLVHDRHDASHVVVAMGQQLLESWDGAHTFTPIAKAPGKVLGLRPDEHTSGSVFVLTRKALFRLGSEAPAVADYAVVSMLRRALRTEPPLREVLRASYDRMVPTVPTRIEYKGLFPKVKLVVGGIHAPAQADLFADFISAASRQTLSAGDLGESTGDADAATFIRTMTRNQAFGGVLLSWDFRNFMLPPSLSRRTREAKKAFKKVESDVRHIFLTRRGLMREMAFTPPVDVVSQLNLTLRIDELTAKLHALSGLYEDTGSFVPKALRKHVHGLGDVPALLDASADHFVVDEAQQAGRKLRAQFRSALPVVQLSGGVWATQMQEELQNYELLGGDRPWIRRSAYSYLADVHLQAVWDLKRLVFSVQELNVVRLNHIRRIVHMDVLEAHFQRMRLQAELETSRRHRGLQRMMLELEVERLQKEVDALTGHALDAELARASSTPSRLFHAASASSPSPAVSSSSSSQPRNAPLAPLQETP